MNDGSSDSGIREVHTLPPAAASQIMKGNFRLLHAEGNLRAAGVRDEHHARPSPEVILGGLKSHMTEIKRWPPADADAPAATSYHSAVATRQLLEELTELPVVVELGQRLSRPSDARIATDVGFFISQSDGRPPNTILALRYCKARGAPSSSASQHTIVALVMFGLMMSDDRISFSPRRHAIIKALEGAARTDQGCAHLWTVRFSELAKDLPSETTIAAVMGRGYNFATCLEGALKIKELTYMHSACMNAMHEVTARGGQPIVMCHRRRTRRPPPARRAAIEVPKTVDCMQVLLNIISTAAAELSHCRAEGY
uniref:Uncharacterized protein n=1 Tax=Macrostomum lignano TaxID=282301 RepID=A0A1I8FFP2_9PLAT